MSIIRKVRAIERIYERLDMEINQFQQSTGLHCYSGCGKCCTKPDIEASPLEFLPLAFYWFQHGMATTNLERLKQEKSAICMVYSPIGLVGQFKGSCGDYPHRGLICRLFGYGASKDKMGELRLVTCKLIKEGQVEQYEQAIHLLKSKSTVPIFTDYYQKLMQIDFHLGNQILPINEAIAVAIETIMHYYSYRPFPKPRNAA